MNLRMENSKRAMHPGHRDIKMDRGCSAPEKTGRKNYKILSPRRACTDGLNII